MSFDNLSVGNCFLSKGVLVVDSITNDSNNNDSKSKFLQKSVMNVGSAYTQGNTVTIPIYDQSLSYGPTGEDLRNLRNKFRTLFRDYPLLDEYPWLVPTEPQKITGRGNGTIEIYNVSPQLNGRYYNIVHMDQYYNLNISGDIPLQPAPRNINWPEFPFSGMIYSGNLVQYYFSDGKVSVIPYQAGRGIPQWDVTKEYYSGNPYGIPQRLGVALRPRLSMGAVVGNNDFCLGVVQESSGSCKLFDYNIPPTLTKQQKLFYNKNHPSPFSTEPVDNLSPYNRSNTNWAPWPWYYAYKSGDPVPILTKGRTNLRIGASYNIGMQCYYEPNVEPGDDPRNNPKYLPVQTIPLFQGEKVKIGSEIYATSMGHVITWDRRGVSPYPVASATSTAGLNTNSIFPLSFNNPQYLLLQGNMRDARDENPWWDWCDPTFGAVGWCSTPGFSLAGIPDVGVAICESVDGQNLPYLAQSLQGSVIVRASSTEDPLDPIVGSGRMELINGSEYCDTKFRGVTKMPGDSERGQIVGNVMQEIAGTGRWGYDGSYVGFGGTPIDGYRYTVGIYNLFTSDRLSTGSGGVIDVTSVDSNGSIVGFNVVSLGSGYYEGELLRVVDNDDYPRGTPYFKKNCAVVRFVGGTFVRDSRGTNYVSKYGCIGYNITKNPVPTTLDVILGNNSETPRDLVYGKVSSRESVSVNATTQSDNASLGFERRYWPLNFFSNQKINKQSALSMYSLRQVIFGTNTTVQSVLTQFTGDPFAYDQGVNDYSIQFYGAFKPMELTVVANEDGQVTDVRVTDFGVGNDIGDLILVYQYNSDNNYIFQYNAPTDTPVARLVSGGGGYIFEQNNNIKWVNPNNIYDIKSSPFAIKAMSADESGTLNNLSWNVEIYNYKSTVALPLGSTQIVSQTVHIEYALGQPITEPWSLYAKNETATFYLDAYARIINVGSGYVSGEYGTNEPGGLLVELVVDGGIVVDVVIVDYGTTFNNDIFTINGGDGNCKIILQINNQESVYNYRTAFGDNNVLNSCLNYDYQLISRGTNYSTIDYTTSCPNRVGDNMLVRVLSVGVNNEVEAIEITDPGNMLYNIGDVVTLINGVPGTPCYFRIVAPLKSPEKIRWHRNGTNYTTAQNVPTYNIQQNNLILPGNISGGGCTPVSTDPPFPFVLPPYFSDLSRYSVGDNIRFIQNNNESSLTNITFIGFGIIQVSNVNPGAGYVVTGPSDDGWFGTRNDTINPTTVDIVADDNGHITNVTINTLGDRVRFGDLIIIEQPGSDRNAVFQITSLRDVTPWWEEEINGRVPTSEQWNNYRDVLKSGVNLMDKSVAVELSTNYPNYYNNSYYNNGDGGRDFVNNVGVVTNYVFQRVEVD